VSRLDAVSASPSGSETRAELAVARALRGPSAMASVMRGPPPSTAAPRTC